MRFLCVVGTRPEAIKMAPLILELARHAKVTTLCSGQHTALAQEPLDWFGIGTDDRIVLDPQLGTLSAITGTLLVEMERMIAKHKPDVVVAQGDTTTLMAAALSSFYLGVRFAHVEAGLRTGNLQAPFPEEFNRVTASRLAAWHFCPTQGAADNLLREGVDPGLIVLTGNTGIDALRLTLAKVESSQVPAGRRRILMTAHRRENHGERMASICQAVRTIAEEFDDVEFIIPVHPNPAVGESIAKLLRGLERVSLLPPLSYQRLVSEMMAATLILTDSGGIQEEAPFLRKPVLVMRGVTERPEAVDLGVAALVGAESGNIVDAVRRLLTDAGEYARMASGGSPYGDGYAAQRIAAAFGLGNAVQSPPDVTR